VNKFNFSSLLFLIIVFLPEAFSQNQSELETELFQFTFFGDSLVVQNNNGEIVYTKEYQNPFGYLSDLDSDGNDEFLVRDSSVTLVDQTLYELYIYNVLDTFYMAGKINSGTTEPYESDSGEIEGLIIVTGNPDFSYLNENSEYVSLPLNCWKFEDGEIHSVNDEVYDLFMNENNKILSALDDILSGDKSDCDSMLDVKSLIASAYINYLNAGENAVASNLISTYYPCEDASRFRQELDSIFQKENQ
jgi:hypothetical protein